MDVSGTILGTHSNASVPRVAQIRKGNTAWGTPNGRQSGFPVVCGGAESPKSGDAESKPYRVDIVSNLIYQKCMCLD